MDNNIDSITDTFTDSSIPEQPLVLTESPGELWDISPYIDVDAFNRLTTEDFPYIFGIAFAGSTIIVLLTYGVFKAISLIRIKK